jgi:hypothetical protein
MCEGLLPFELFICSSPKREKKVMVLLMSGSVIEGRLVEAAGLWRRSPMTGFSPSRRSPFASDGPWNLMTRKVRAGGVWEAWRQEIDDAAVQAARDKGAFASGADSVRGLSTEEVERRDEASEWLAWVPEADRMLVLDGVTWQAATGRRIDWARMLRWQGLERGKEGLRKRYARALAALAVEVERRARLAA